MTHRKSKHTPFDKVAATLAALPLIAAETALNAEHLAHAGGWLSTLVAGAIGATIAAAAALPIAERAVAQGCWLKAAGLAIFFAAMLAFSFSTSVGRVGSQADGDLAAAQSHNGKLMLAREAYQAATATQEAECGSGRGPRCRAAETALTAAREALQAAPAAKAENAMAKRLAAASGLSEATVALYQPLIFPLALQLGGFVFLAYGLSPRRETALKAKPKPKARAKRTPKPRKGGKVVAFDAPRLRAVN